MPVVESLDEAPASRFNTAMSQCRQSSRRMALIRTSTCGSGSAQLRALCLLASLLLMPACGTPTDPHRVTLRSGQVMVATTRPALDDKTGYFRFRDRNKKDVLVRPDEVTIIERL